MTGNLHRRTLLAAALGAGVPLRAQERDRHAVLSLVGDRFDVVVAHPTTESHQDRNTHKVMLLSDNQLDRQALLVLDKLLRARDASTEPVLLASQKGALYAGQQSLFADAAEGEASEALWATLRGVDATHLLLVRAHRAEARMPFDHGRVGIGWIAGLGFYIDANSAVMDRDTGNVRQGYIGTFAYLSVDRIDLRTRQRIGRAAAHEADVSASVFAPRAPTPWQTMTAPEKARRLREVMLRAVGLAGRELLAA